MNKIIHLSIDGIEISAPSGTTILEAAQQHDVDIPHLCHHVDLKPAGACRLCLVDISHPKGPVTACDTPIAENMIVRTTSEDINTIRHHIVKLLLNYNQNHLSEYSQSKLKKLANDLGIHENDSTSLIKSNRHLPIDDSNPFFSYDPNSCVLCGICVRTCDEWQETQAIHYANRGYETTITPFNKEPWIDSRCESCGECVERCPTGALTIKKSDLPSKEVATTCSYCGCGCGLYLGVRDHTIISARGHRECPANHGSLCVKGRFGYEFINSPDRLTQPLIKRNEKFEVVSWNEAFDFVAKKLSHYKGNQFALFSSAKCTNEDNYILQKFVRIVMQTNNIDHCARLCHAPTVAGLAQSLGSGAMTNSIDEIGEANCIFAIGTNTTEAHPIIALQIKRAAKKGAKLIVANPLEIDLCRHATIFLQHKPGTDVALMMGMMRVIVDEHLQDEHFIHTRCENFDAFKKSLSAFDLNTVEKITGVSKEKIATAARMYASTKPGSILYAMGITQHTHGTDNVLATSNLALLTGNIGKPSSGVNPLRGQNNVQGACDMGALPNFYPGYQKVEDKSAQEKFENAWGIHLDNKAGLTHTEIFTAVDHGKIKALYFAGENPAQSEADASHAINAIKKAEFIVVQDIFMTETAKLADVILPAASFAEKEGTFTNTERRVQRVRRAIEPIGDSKNDWEIICELAKRMGATGFEFDHPSLIFNEMASLTPQYAGITYERLEKESLQWPCRNSTDPGTKFLHQEKFATPSGKGQFIPLAYKSSKELPDAEYPLILTTDRSLYHFHTGTMTREVEGLNILRAGERIEINPIDAKALNIKEGEKVNVISRRGSVTTIVKITPASPPGVVAMTFHFKETPTNVLTLAEVDPIAKIPETKVCAVRIVGVKS